MQIDYGLKWSFATFLDVVPTVKSPRIRTYNLSKLELYILHHY